MFINMSLQESPCLLYISNDLRASDHFRLDSAQISNVFSKFFLWLSTAPADCGWNRCIEWYWNFCFVVHSLSCVQLFAISWTATCQAPLSTLSRSLFKFTSIESVILTISYSAISFFCYVTPCNNLPQAAYISTSPPQRHKRNAYSGLFVIGRKYVRANMYAWPGHWDYQRKKTGEKFWI